MNSLAARVVDLLRPYSPPSPGIHLDLGGRLATISGQLPGRDYVCVTDSRHLHGQLASYGLECHHVQAETDEEWAAVLADALAGRSLASVSFAEPTEGQLRAMARLAGAHGAFAVAIQPAVPVPFLPWFAGPDSDALDERLRNAGLQPIARSDLPREPAASEHPFLAEGTAVSSVLCFLAAAIDKASPIACHMRLCIPRPAPALGEESRRPAPFLSVVTRTQGQRPHTLREALLCLAAQTCTDFEVLVVAHKVPPDCRPALDEVLDGLPEWLRAKTRLLAVDEGNRCRPLNVGFAEARGSYIAILDDDDIPFANWVETFQALADEHRGRVLRAVAVRQNVEEVTVLGRKGLRAIGPPELRYPSCFDLFDHLYENHSPPVSLAFPRGVFHDLHQRFDEALTTLEDWDYLMRAAAIVGTASSPKVTSIYRWWPSGQSSRTEHSSNEWRHNREHILQKMDAIPILLPPGTAGHLRAIVEMRDILRVQLRARNPEQAGGMARIKENPALFELRALLESTSWRLSRPLRLISRNSLSIRDLATITTADEASRLVELVRSSRSWRLTAPLRRLARRRR